MTAPEAHLDVRRRLLAAALLGLVATAATSGETAGTSGPFLLWALLLWGVGRGSHLAWVLAGTVSASSAVLLGCVALAAAAPAATTTAAPMTGLVALLHLAATGLLVSRPVRGRVGRAGRRPSAAVPAAR